MYTIRQASKLLSVSRQSIYSKLDSQQLTTHVKIINCIKMINDEGIEILRSIYDCQDNCQAVKQPVNELTEAVDNNSETYLNQYIQSLHQQITDLKNIVNDYKKLLDNKQDDIDKMHKLFENFQVLLQNNNRLLEQNNKKNIFAKWFKRK